MPLVGLVPRDADQDRDAERHRLGPGHRPAAADDGQLAVAHLGEVGEKHRHAHRAESRTRGEPESAARRRSPRSRRRCTASSSGRALDLLRRAPRRRPRVDREARRPARRAAGRPCRREARRRATRAPMIPSTFFSSRCTPDPAERARCSPRSRRPASPGAGLSARGRETQSKAFFSWPGIEPLNSGVATRIASAAAIASLRRSTPGGSSLEVLVVRRDLAEVFVEVELDALGQLLRGEAEELLVWSESARRLPEIPRIRTGYPSSGGRDEDERGGELDLVGQHRAALGERGVPVEPDSLRSTGPRASTPSLLMPHGSSTGSVIVPVRVTGARLPLTSSVPSTVTVVAVARERAALEAELGVVGDVEEVGRGEVRREVSLSTSMVDACAMPRSPPRRGWRRTRGTRLRTARRPCRGQGTHGRVGRVAYPGPRHGRRLGSGAHATCPPVVLSLLEKYLSMQVTEGTGGGIPG